MSLCEGVDGGLSMCFLCEGVYMDSVRVCLYQGVRVCSLK